MSSTEKNPLFFLSNAIIFERILLVTVVALKHRRKADSYRGDDACWCSHCEEFYEFAMNFFIS